MAERHEVKERKCGWVTHAGTRVAHPAGGCNESILGTAADMRKHAATHQK